MHSENPTPDASASADVPDLDTDGLANELEQLRAALAGVREEALRERADLDNQRKRLARDLEQARRFANEKLLSQLLPVLDSLEAGLKAAGDSAGPLRDGLELTLRQLLKVGEDNGLAQLDPEGQAFDPEWHQAISQLESPDASPGTVLQVFQKGYALHDRLLRPALVVVAAG
ncbi:nucleotide exchange factor GrpE [Arenimonas caeni]|jgi:molecular chaperone GrpE|uniref:nucleotide exchange factor GrpE n=1 Tax=Arenimonas caeni TaxID=2058085 RepID=UPI002A363D5D|nr:nucleotide exchange factor GrpE [Arenimonas caeni]MDY0020918.1 nucleotide exchange factor GrpE [Arenimonas caeni]